MQDKDLKYYLSLDYDVILRKIVEGDNVYYKATTRELNQDVFYGIGDSVEEAVAELRAVCDEVFPFYFEKGIVIPEPHPHTEDLPSGNFPVRSTPTIHKKLSDLAKENQISLNAMVNKILTEYVTVEALTDSAASKIRQIACSAAEPGSMAWANSANYQIKTASEGAKDKVTHISPYIKKDERHVAGT